MVPFIKKKKKGALQKLQHLAECLMSSKHDRRLAKSGSTIMNKSSQKAQNPLLLVRALKCEIKFSEDHFWCSATNEKILCYSHNWYMDADCQSVWMDCLENILVIPSFLSIFFSTFPMKYLHFYLINWHKTLWEHSLFSEDESHWNVLDPPTFSSSTNKVNHLNVMDRH